MEAKRQMLLCLIFRDVWTVPIASSLSKADPLGLSLVEVLLIEFRIWFLNGHSVTPCLKSRHLNLKGVLAVLVNVESNFATPIPPPTPVYPHKATRIRPYTTTRPC